MQKESLESFIKEINDIREYIDYVQLVNEISTCKEYEDGPALKLKNHLVNFGVSKKVFEYRSITITLYGILEKHINLWIEDYINHIPKVISNYNDLSETLRKNHFDLSVSLINYVNEKKNARFEELDTEEVIKKLSACLLNPSVFNFNSKAFCPRSGNLKHSKISEALSCLEIKLTNSLKVVGSRPGGFLENITNIANKGDELFWLLDDLVERRNYIAHGGTIDNILNILEFNEYIDFLEKYGIALFQILIEKLIEIEANYAYEAVARDKILNIVKKGSVLCVNLEHHTLKQGDYMIIGLVNGGFMKKEILDLQINGESFNTLNITDDTDVGINLGGGISQGQKFFIKSC